MLFNSEPRYNRGQRHTKASRGCGYLRRQTCLKLRRETSQKINLISIFSCFPPGLCLIVKVLITCKPNSLIGPSPLCQIYDEVFTTTRKPELFRF